VSDLDKRFRNARFHPTEKLMQTSGILRRSHCAALRQAIGLPLCLIELVHANSAFPVQDITYGAQLGW